MEPLAQIKTWGGPPPEFDQLPYGTPVVLNNPDSPLPSIDVRWCEGQRFMVRTPYPIKDYRHGREFEIPAGFFYNGASVPRPGWIFAAPFELGVAATAGHDLLYHYSGQLNGCTYTRLEADRLFYDMMKKEKIPEWRSRPAYLFVRAGGRRAWKKQRGILIPQGA